MRKRLLTMLLCVTMVVFTLCGCGSKETDTKPIESTEIEEQKEVVESEAVEEPETIAQEEVVEPSSEPIEEPTQETNTNLDIVVEVSPEIQQAKDEKMPIGEETTLDFGTIIRLGDNEDYPNALEDIEIHYMDKVFQMALPKDMCTDIGHDNDTNSWVTWNEGKSKTALIMFASLKATIDEKVEKSDEKFKEYVTKTFACEPMENSNTEVLLVSDELIVHKIAGKISTYMGELAMHDVYDCEPFEEEKEDGSILTYDKGYRYMFFYGDKDISANAELASYIAESFKVVE